MRFALLAAAGKAAARAAARSVRRFMANEPSNKYETIIFKAVRDMAYNFGKAATA